MSDSSRAVRFVGISLGRRLLVLALVVGAVIQTACAPLVATRVEPRPALPKEAMPYFWPYPNVPEPNWPAAHPDAIYKEGMTSQQYLDHLCQLEAGEFIYKTVPDVESLYFVRLHGRPVSDAEYSRNVLEDPYNMESGLTWDMAVAFAIGDSIPNTEKDRATLILTRRNYRFVEAPQTYFREGQGIPESNKLYIWGPLADLTANDFVLPSKPGQNRYTFRTKRSGTGTQYARVEKNPDEIVYVRRVKPGELRNISIYSHSAWYKLTYTDQITSRYGVVWRGIQRPRDREMNISGAELIILDLHTNEILGVSRGFVRGVSGSYRFGPGVDWTTLNRCPISQDDHGNRYPIWPWQFINRVLQPVELKLPNPLDEPPEFRPELSRSQTATGESNTKK